MEHEYGMGSDCTDLTLSQSVFDGCRPSAAPVDPLIVSTRLLSSFLGRPGCSWKEGRKVRGQ